jgi:hypothetical protein
MGGMNPGDAPGQFVQRQIPADRLRCGCPLQPAHGLQQTGLLGIGGRGRQMQGAALGAQTAQVGRMLGIATHAGNLQAIGLDDHAAADTAIGTGGLGFFHGVPQKMRN